MDVWHRSMLSTVMCSGACRAENPVCTESSSNAFFSWLILYCITLVSLSLELLTVTQSRISMQRKEAVTPNLCSHEELMTDTQRLRHLISEKGPGLSSGACDVTEGAPRMARVTAKFGLCGREAVKWTTKNDQPATELLHLYSALM